MIEKNEATSVIFRKCNKAFGGEVIALFPELPADVNGYYVTCYQHIGQHGSADYNSIVFNSKLAVEAEYSALKKELESEPFGYVFNVCSKQTSKMRENCMAIAKEYRCIK